MTVMPSPETRLEAEKLLSNPIFFPDEFKKWLGDFVVVNIPLIPFSHIFGAHVNIARSGAYVATSETASDPLNYSDCATVGPQILGMSDGKYLVMYGCSSRGQMAPSWNGSTPDDNESVAANESGPPGGRMVIKSLQNNNNNSIVLKYKTTRTFSRRWLVCVRLGSP